MQTSAKLLQNARAVTSVQRPSNMNALQNALVSGQSGPNFTTNKAHTTGPISKWVAGHADGRTKRGNVFTILLICIALFAFCGATTASAAVSSLSCSSASVSGFANNACTVKLNTAAPTGGLSVGLSSSNAAVTVPATVTVPAGATSAGFTADASAVGSTQNATLSASSAGVTTTYVMSLTGVVSTMSVSTTSVAFGTVPVNTAATQSVTLKSVGTWPVDINSASVQGTGFSVSGGTFPAKLSPGQSLTLTVQVQSSQCWCRNGQIEYLLQLLGRKFDSCQFDGNRRFSHCRQFEFAFVQQRIHDWNWK